MKRFFVVAFLATIVLCGFNSCEDPASNGTATYYGIVMDETTDMPYESVDVKVTDGDRIHTTTLTDGDGYFSVDVRLQEITKDYYIQVGNARIGTKRVDFPGFGVGRYDLGIITVKGPTVPTVETVEVTNIKSKMATGGGKVTSSGGYAVTKRGVCWNTSQYPTIDNAHTEDGTGAGEYFSNIGDLQPNTTYYVRAYAENEKGVAYGNQVTFTTESGIPTVQTSLVRVDGKTVVYYEGSVIDAGDSPVTARGICWGTSTPTIANQKTLDGDGIGGYSGSVTVSNVHSQDLYIRAYATNGSGTAYGKAIKIDHRNPYNLPVVEDQNVKYIILPYDLAPSYMGGGANKALELCEGLVAYDYSDWELPTVRVLTLMYENRAEIGGFLAGDYWSSTYADLMYESGVYTQSYYYIDFSSGKVYHRYGIKNVRPARQY